MYILYILRSASICTKYKLVSTAHVLVTMVSTANMECSIISVAGPSE